MGVPRLRYILIVCILVVCCTGCAEVTAQKIPEQINVQGQVVPGRGQQIGAGHAQPGRQPDAKPSASD